MRKHYLDNIRWVTVLLVLLYHAVYFFNNKGVFGGIGGFVSDPKGQPQDVIMYILYPWFMMLLFLVAGISSRYALERSDFNCSRFIKSRTRKLLVPATIGLVVFQWMTGYFNTQIGGVYQGIPDMVHTMPLPTRIIVCIIAGIGPLWFVQDLWLFSLLLALIVKIDKERLYSRLHKLFDTHRRAATGIALLLGFFAVWGGAQLCVPHPAPDDLSGLLNLYRPATYLVLFLLGYFIFSVESIQQRLQELALPMLLLALVSGTILIAQTWGQCNTDPLYLMNWRTNLYAYSAILAILGCFRAWGNKETPFSRHMTRSSYGIYVVHYLVVTSIGYMLKVYTSLPPVADYLILLAAVMLLSPALYELIRRIPLLRWCILGEKQTK